MLESFYDRADEDPETSHGTVLSCSSTRNRISTPKIYRICTSLKDLVARGRCSTASRLPAAPEPGGGEPICPVPWALAGRLRQRDRLRLGHTDRGRTEYTSGHWRDRQCVRRDGVTLALLLARMRAGPPAPWRSGGFHPVSVLTGEGVRQKRRGPRQRLGPL